MRFGKIRVENNELRFTRMMKSYMVPCADIRWAYRRRENGSGKTGRINDAAAYHTSFVVILTRREKRYQFEMTEEEARVCLNYLKECNPDLITGIPKGAPIPARSLMNTRDLGGFRTQDGHHILPGQLLRSGELYHLSAEDVRLLREEYHVGTVVDFRTEMERKNKPDTLIPGSVYIDNPIFEEGMFGITREGNPMDLLLSMQENPDAYMMTMYQKLVLDGQCRHQYAKFFQYLLENEEGSCILWHCSAGKDRAGIASMLLLFALGVPRGAVMDDYMRTNTCLEKDLEYLARLMDSRGVPRGKIRDLRAVLSAKECYLQSAINTINAEFGSVERYLRRAMYLTAGSLNRLRARYLV